MSGWQDDVLGAYLGSVTERGFDGPFIAYLSAAGFTDIHLLHGAFEFGKDFVAKRDGIQWAFQTKVGNLGLAPWREVRGQVEEMLWNDIAHPSFDTSLARTAVLVTTGRLVGAASAEAQQYRASLFARSAGATRQSAFEVWDRETLLEGMTANPALSLNAWDQDALRQFLGLRADAERRLLTVQSIERTSRSWPPGDLTRACVASSVLANTLTVSGRPDLATSSTYALIRTALLHPAGTEHSDTKMTFRACRALFRESAERTLDDIEPVAGDPAALLNLGTEFPSAVTYPVRCSVILETVGMQGLLAAVEDDVDTSSSRAELLGEFVRSQPGAAHPISDRWALSLVPAATLLRRHGSADLVPWMERVVAWICDRHERMHGLASPYASPAAEVARLLGEPYEHIDLGRRSSSYLATIVLDLACCLELPAFYGDAYNDFAAVQVGFPTVEPRNEPGMLLHDETGVIAEANVSFDDPESEPTDGWKRAIHHRRSPSSFHFDNEGLSWEVLAASLLLSDRHFLRTTRLLSGLELV